MEPDERTYVQHLATGRFQQGVDQGRWRVTSGAWPNPVIVVAAAERPGAPDELALRFDLTGYATVAPTAEPWDLELDAALAADLWPAGGRVETAFNPNWGPPGGGHAIYIPMDRKALEGHENWRQVHPAAVWDPSRMDIVDYLKVIYELLHSSAYAGNRRSA